MTLTINAKTFTADAATSANSIPYVGPAQTILSKDRMELGRTPPKANAAYSGNARSRAKFSRTHTLTGAKTTSGDAIFDVTSSIPVGTSDAAIDTLCDDAASLIGSASFKTSLKSQKINF